MKTRKIELQPLDVADTGYSQYYRETVEGGQQLDVTVHGNPDASHVMVNCLPWSEYTLRPDANARYGVMAWAADAQVISIDNPGVGKHGSILSKHQRAALREGDLSLMTDMQHEALANVAQREGIYLGKAALVGNSLGAIMATNLVPRLQTGSLTLVEPVGIVPKSKKNLVRGFLHDAKRDPAYNAENPQWFKNVTKFSMPSQPVTLYNYVEMMARGDYFAGESLDGIKTTIVYGTDSTVVPEADVAVLAEQLPLAEVWQLPGENHSMLNSVGRTALLYQLLNKHGRL